MRIGVDLGGTKIEAIALDDDGSERARLRVPTPGSAGYEAVVAAVRGLVLDIERMAGGRGTVGVGTPGAISPSTGLLKNSNTVALNGRPLDRDLAQALEREVRVANDADCFTLSEAIDGAAAGAPTVFGVIVGTGTGGGIVAHGRLLSGPNAIAGEWGHDPLPWPSLEELPGPECYCGKRGCIETWLSGPGLAADHERATGARLAPKEIAARMAAGDAGARATLERHADRFARALSMVINVLDPHVIVLGGGVSNLAHLYEAVPARWDRYVAGDGVRTSLVPARHGDSSGVRGAAWLWPA
ncbi:MAG: ROK family protein [Sandaracinaceae bacterium]|nr:ROK family protein [Sandaracinaceae bacterium]